VINSVRVNPGPKSSCKRVRLTARGETFAGGRDDLGLSMISGNGGRLIVSLAEATRLENSKLSSVDRLKSGLSSYDAFKRSSAATRMYDSSRFNFRRDVVSFGGQNHLGRIQWSHALIAVPNITPPPMTRQVSWWGFIPALSESEMVLGLRGAALWRTTGAGDPDVSLCWLVLVAEILGQVSLSMTTVGRCAHSLTFVLRRRLSRPRARLSRYPKPR